MRKKTITVELTEDVDIDLDDFFEDLSDADIIAELESRDYLVHKLVGKLASENIEAREKLEAIRRILDVKKWQGCDRILQELTELINYAGKF